jgi:AcrR family transcriptional regulator
MTKAESPEKYAAKKNEVLNAAKNAFARHGFLKTTLDDIAKSLRMRKASLYYYYKNKEAILNDVVEHEGQTYLEKVNAEMSREKTAVKKASRLVRVRLKHFLQAMSLYKLSAQAYFEVKPLINELYKDFRQKEVELLKVLIKDGVRSGEFSACNAEKVAEAILTVTDGVELRGFQQALSKGEINPDYDWIEAEALSVVGLILNGITIKR